MYLIIITLLLNSNLNSISNHTIIKRFLRMLMTILKYVAHEFKGSYVVFSTFRLDSFDPVTNTLKKTVKYLLLIPLIF